jgi:hypothetical protein
MEPQISALSMCHKLAIIHMLLKYLKNRLFGTDPALAQAAD